MHSAKVLDKQIAHYLTSLNVKEKRAVLTVVKTFVEGKQDWLDEIGDSQQKAINKSIADQKSGAIVSHQEIVKKFKKWQKK